MKNTMWHRRCATVSKARVQSRREGGISPILLPAIALVTVALAMVLPLALSPAQNAAVAITIDPHLEINFISQG